MGNTLGGRGQGLPLERVGLGLRLLPCVSEVGVVVTLTNENVVLAHGPIGGLMGRVKDQRDVAEGSVLDADDPSGQRTVPVFDSHEVVSHNGSGEGDGTVGIEGANGPATDNRVGAHVLSCAHAQNLYQGSDTSQAIQGHS